MRQSQDSICLLSAAFTTDGNTLIGRLIDNFAKFSSWLGCSTIYIYYGLVVNLLASMAPKVARILVDT